MIRTLHLIFQIKFKKRLVFHASFLPAWLVVCLFIVSSQPMQANVCLFFHSNLIEPASHSQL